ncbi:DUF3795 domain-containing protein [Candidatus Bipolaricaulota bacterium]
MSPSSIDYRQMTSPCGLDCFNCPAHLAMTDDEERARWAQMTGKPLEEAFCTGCRNEGGAISLFGRDKPCSAWTCVQEKGLEFCCDCEEFPCDNLHPYVDRASVVPHNTKVFNLGLIKRMGLESWAEEKAKTVREVYFNAPFGSCGGTCST